MELTQAYVRECFDYDPATGNLIWRERPRSHFKCGYIPGPSSRVIGCVAGVVCPKGYRQISVAGKLYKAHRLVWFWTYGYFPAQEIDHINRNKLDNRIENLRECSTAQNIRARGFSKKLKSRGTRLVPSGRWQASIRADGRTQYLGTFLTEKDAALAYARAAVDHFGAFAPIEAKELFEAAYP